LNEANRSVLSPTHPEGIFCDDVQNWLKLGGRAGDYAEDFTCRGLLLQRFFEFSEQPHILDGDDRLVGKGLVKGRTSVRRAISAPINSSF
jgi:hypothetical protein